MAMINETTDSRSRFYESLIYISIWVCVFCFPLVAESFAATQTGSFIWAQVFRGWVRTLPYLCLFLIHEYLIIPRYLSTNKLRRYIIIVIIVLVVFGIGNGIVSHNLHEFPRDLPEMVGPHPSGPRPEKPGPPPNLMHPPPHPDIHLFPFIVPVIMAMLLIGLNLAISLMFRYYKEQEVRKQLENMRLKDELKYLKSQVNPHFFMNMLNNIHALVETAPSKSQDMILKLSKLMRYVLYEGDNGSATLRNEINFISTYIDLMRQRYPEGKVCISSDLPSDPSESILLPPLIFICFLENAFKHGVSYRRMTEIEVSITEESGKVRFYCRNTKPQNESERKEGGLGLENVRRRLDLLYGSDYILQIDDTDDDYIVILLIPSL